MTAIAKLSDNELIDRLKKDDQVAFTEIYNRYSESLAGFAGAKLYNLEDARDILHDLFVKLWEDRHTLTISSNLKSYLFTATRYRIIDKIRRNVTRQEYSTLLQALAENTVPSIEKEMEARELHQLLERSLEQLPGRTKQIYRLSRHGHHTIAEISVMLNLSEQTVKNQLSTALKHLRQSLTISNLIMLLAWSWLK